MKKIALFLCLGLFSGAADIGEVLLQDLIAQARQAKWFNDKGNALHFPGNPNDPKGFARVLTVRLEDGNQYSDVLETHPRWEANGWIEARYSMSIPRNSFFESQVGFIEGASNSDGVIFEILWTEANQQILLQRLEKRYSLQLESLKIDLGAYAGHSGNLVLRVKAGLSSSQDWAVWRNPRIAPVGPQALESRKTRAITPPLKPGPPQKEADRTHPTVTAQPKSGADQSHPTVKAQREVDSDQDGIFDFDETELLQKFRPYFRFSRHDGQDEPYLPVDAVWLIQHSNLKPSADEQAESIFADQVLREQPNRILTAEAWPGSSNLTRNPKKTSYALNVENSARHGYLDGEPYPPGLSKEGIWNEIIQRGNIGLYGHVVPYGKYIKIEYLQLIGYSDAMRPILKRTGDHEGDWMTVQVIYDPQDKEPLRILHYAHGKEMSFDFRLTENIRYLENEAIKEFHGPNYGVSNIDIAAEDDYERIELGNPSKTHFHGRKAAQNHIVQMFKDPASGKYLHPVVYIECGSHEFWPSPYWNFIFWLTETEAGFEAKAPSHDGDSHAYLTRDVPNLGEVEHPADLKARIILWYNGRWGAFASYKQDPPPGPALHREWTWPPRSALRASIPEDDFEDGTSIGHHVVEEKSQGKIYKWPAVLEVLASFDFAQGDGLAAGDLDGDGKAEIIQADRDNALIVYNSAGKRISKTDQDIEIGDRLAAGDVNRDGRDEIILADRSENKIWIMAFTGSAFHKTSFPRDFEAGDDMAAADVNGDPKAEIIIGDRSENAIYVYDSNGQELLKFLQYWVNGSRLAAGDLDGDGRAEIIMSDKNKNVIRIFRAQGPPSSFNRSIEVQKGDTDEETAVFTDGIAAGDVDGDGRDEIIFADMSEDKIYIYDSLGQEKGRFFCNFERGDGLAAGHITGSKMAEIVHGDRDDFLRVFSLPSWQRPSSHTGQPYR